MLVIGLKQPCVLLRFYPHLNYLETLQYFYQECLSPCPASICSMSTPSKDTTSKNNPPMHLILSPPADGVLSETTVLHLGYVILSKQPSLCSLTFAFICCSRQSNNIINKDHKQVMAFIPPKFMVQKRSFSVKQRWLSAIVF